MILKNKKITVVGLGKSGFAAANFLVQKKAIVRVTDSSQKKEVLENAGFLRGLGVAVETGGHTQAFIRESDLVVTSPGVPKDSLPLSFARRKKIPIIGEVELAALFCPARIIAVTGSNGKTTTCHLIHRFLVEGGKKSVLCGNVGTSFLDSISQMDSKTFAVVELSSFQLEDCNHLKPEIAVVLNISTNHLDRHKTLECYLGAKERIFAKQTPSERLILNFDDPRVAAMAKKARSKIIFYSKKPLVEGVFLKEGNLVIRLGKDPKHILGTNNFLLRGEHNLENILAATGAASILGIGKTTLEKVLNSFTTLEHRIEELGRVRGVHFINDSKSTTVSSTRAAVLSLTSPIVLIAGGRDKGASFGEIEALLEKRVKMVVLYGEAREKIASLWKVFKHVQMERDFEKAVKMAFENASPGDSVLLSPMCTSFDQFHSFEARGEAFKRIFQEFRGSWKP